MTEQINPYYNPEKLGLKMISFDEQDLGYEYNTLCFWATKDGKIYSASDMGCSCPTPFENYEGEDQDSVIQKLERVGSSKQAIDIFNSWGHGSGIDKDDLVDWIEKNINKRSKK